MHRVVDDTASGTMLPMPKVRFHGRHYSYFSSVRFLMDTALIMQLS
jgi:hypothetical protein